MKNLLNVFIAGALIASPLLAEDASIYSPKGVGGKNITAFDRVGERKIGGYFDNEFFAMNSAQTFKAHRLILQASSQIHEKIFFNTEIEYEYGGVIEDTADGSGGDGEIKIEQAWVDFEYAEDHYFRSGIVIVPFGILNVLHDSDVRDTTNRPIHTRYIVPTTWFDSGAGAHGSFDVSDWEFTYEGYVINGLSEGISGTSGLRNARPSLKEDNNKGSALAGRLGISPMLGLDLGLSLYTGTYSDTDDESVTLKGLDFMWKNGPVEMLGEYAEASIDAIDDTVPGKMNGYYLEGRYHFMPSLLKKAFFAQGFDNPTFTAFARYGEVDLDTSVTDVYDRSQFTVGLNYRPVSTVVFKAEYEMNTEEVDDNTVGDAVILSVAVGF